MGLFFFTAGLFDLFMILFVLLIIGILIIMAIYSIKDWNKQKEKINIMATVHAKRMIISASDSIGKILSFYATFETENGEKIEFLMSAREYANLKEGDQGKLSFQGVHYLGFLKK